MTGQTATGDDVSPEPFRFIADEAFSLSERGTTVVGSIASGVVSVGDVLRFEGDSRVPPFVCEGISGVRVGDWQPGQPATVALLVPALERSQIRRGDVLVTAGG